MNWLEIIQLVIKKSLKIENIAKNVDFIAFLSN